MTSRFFQHTTHGAARSLLIAGCCLWLAGSAAAQEKTATAVDAAAAAKNRIEIKDFQFQPATLTVPAGTKVTFVNVDEEPHTVASKDGKFTKSKALDTDREFVVTLTAPGDYAYFCTVHPHMTGKITVTQP